MSRSNKQTHTSAHTWPWIQSWGSPTSSWLIKMCEATPVVFMLSHLSSFPFPLFFPPQSLVPLCARFISYVLLVCLLFFFSVITLSRSTYWFTDLMTLSAQFKILFGWWAVAVGACMCACVCVCVTGGGLLLLYEWLLGRTGGVKEEFVNYEWSTSL